MRFCIQNKQTCIPPKTKGCKRVCKLVNKIVDAKYTKRLRVNELRKHLSNTHFVVINRRNIGFEFEKKFFKAPLLGKKKTSPKRKV